MNTFQARVEEIMRDGVLFGSAVLRARRDFGFAADPIGWVDLNTTVERSEGSQKAIETRRRQAS